MSFSLEDFAEKAIKTSQDNGCSYCDVRAENSVIDGISIENGNIEYSNLQKDSGIGIRVINSGAWGFFSISDPKSNDEVKKAVENASKNSHGAKRKSSKVIENNISGQM